MCTGKGFADSISLESGAAVQLSNATYEAADSLAAAFGLQVTKEKPYGSDSSADNRYSVTFNLAQRSLLLDAFRLFVQAVNQRTPG